MSWFSLSHLKRLTNDEDGGDAEEEDADVLLLAVLSNDGPRPANGNSA